MCELEEQTESVFGCGETVINLLTLVMVHHLRDQQLDKDLTVF